MPKQFRRFIDIFRTSGFLWSSSLLLDRAGLRTMERWKHVLTTPENLAEQVRAILRAWGVSEAHIHTALEHLIYADLHGIDSHGCAMMLQYHRDRIAGRLNVTPQIRIVRESSSTALLDGDRGLGHVAAHQAMELAIEKCRRSGIGVVSVRNSNHYGSAGSYALMAARAGFIGISMTGTPHPAVVPTFGSRAMLGTNPIAFAAPATRNRPFLLDMATSTVPLGKLLTAWRSGDALPEGWALDNKGQPLTNARLAVKHRRLTPLGSTRAMGSHKGYGLAAMVEILSSILGCSQYCIDPEKDERSVGHFFLALDPQQFRGEGEFENDLDVMLDSFRGSEPATPSRPVMVAGDPEYSACEQISRSGVPISRSVVEDIRLVCKKCGAPFLLEPGR